MQWNLICRAWEKNSFNFYPSHHKKEERKRKWPSDSHLWRVFYVVLLRYMNLISKFSFSAKDLLLQQLLPSWYSSHVLTKAHWTSKFFLHFFMKHIEIIIFFCNSIVIAVYEELFQCSFEHVQCYFQRPFICCKLKFETIAVWIHRKQKQRSLLSCHDYYILVGNE